jgi:hypothetical protein
MTQTFTPITERIPLAPDFPGTVYTAWSPRTDQQSPDLRPPTDEYALLASWLVHEADEAETQPVIDLAAAMPQPDVRPDGYRPLHRAKSRWARDAVLYGAGWLSCAAVLLVGVHILAAIR